MGGILCEARNWCFCQDFGVMQGEGKKFRSLEVRGKLIALKKAFKIKFKTVQKRSLKCISLILNIIYYLERQALYDNFFLYPVVIESSLIYIGAWSTLSNIFFWWIKITVSLVVRTSDLHHLLTLFAYRRSLDNLFVSGQAVGSSDCLVEVVRMRFFFDELKSQFPW